MKHVEKFIRHLQSSIEKRKHEITKATEQVVLWGKDAANMYDKQEELFYKVCVEQLQANRKRANMLHKQQKTETEMLKWLENIRSCHEEMICAMYGNDTNLLDFSLEEEQHD